MSKSAVSTGSVSPAIDTILKDYPLRKRVTSRKPSKIDAPLENCNFLRLRKMEISGLLAPAKLAVLLHRRRDLLGDTKDRCSKLVVGLDSGA